MKNLQAVFFDMDGLMFDTERLSAALWVKHAPTFGLHLKIEDLTLLRGRNAADGRAAFLEKFGANAPFDALCAAMRAEFQDSLRTKMPILPGLMELLTFLQGQKIPMAVVSSTRKELVRRKAFCCRLSAFHWRVGCVAQHRQHRLAQRLHLLWWNLEFAVAQANWHLFALFFHGAIVHFAQFFKGLGANGLRGIGRHDEGAWSLFGLNGIAGAGARPTDQTARLEAARLDILAISELWHGLAPC